MRDYRLYEDMEMPDKDFPIRVFPCEFNSEGNHFDPHWHEQLELLYFLEGEARIECDSRLLAVKSGDLVVVNSNDLHSGYSFQGKVVYYCIIIDISLLRSSFTDICELKYINPISQNLILFANKISGDKTINRAVRGIISEYRQKELAYELAIKSYIYRILTVLLRSYISRILTEKEYERRVRGLEKLRPVLDFVSQNCTQRLSIEQMARMLNVSPYYFCHLFKAVTGKTFSEFINLLRVKRAELLLKTTALNITEVALSSGFDDMNYFSRIFKKYKKITPTDSRRLAGTELSMDSPFRRTDGCNIQTLHL